MNWLERLRCKIIGHCSCPVCVLSAVCLICGQKEVRRQRRAA